MQKQIESLINNAIDDFNSKWQSHEERNTGVSEYAEKIVNFISSNPVLADSVCNECEKNLPMEGTTTCQWCALADM